MVGQGQRSHSSQTSHSGRHCRPFSFFFYSFCVCWLALTLPSLSLFSNNQNKVLTTVHAFSSLGGKCNAFLHSKPPSPKTPSRGYSSTFTSSRLNFFGNNKNKNNNKNVNEGPSTASSREKKTGTGKTPYNYSGTKVDKDEDVVVPATTYFAQKNDPLIPIIGGSFFLTVFALLGWWLFSPTPESTSTNVKEMTYESMTTPSSSKRR